MDTPRAFTDLMAIVRGYQRSRALTVAAELGVADLLRAGPMAADEIASAVGAQREPLYRLLRALAAVGVFEEHERQHFGLTPMGEYLCSDHPLSVAPAARMFGADYQWKAWGALPHGVRTGATPAKAALGVDVWEYRRQHPADSAVFDAAMRTAVRADTPALVASHDFGRYGVLADIGGGTGATLAGILQACGPLRGILFDQAHVVAGADGVLSESGVADRVQVVGGSFFEAVPAGADAYMLRRVLHDWMDPEAVAILRCIRRSIGPAARLLVLEGVVGPANEDASTKFLDLMMLVSAGGRERTEGEWRALFSASGFAFENCTRVTPNLALLEATPARDGLRD